MTYRRHAPMPSRAAKPSQKRIRNELRAMDALYNGASVAPQMEVSTPRGKQPESEVHPEIARWRNNTPGLVLERNKRRLATPVGSNQPIMLGWLCDGSPDWLGYLPIKISPNMVGKTVAVFVGVEVKRKQGGTLSEAQEAFLNALTDAGGIGGLARSEEQAREIVARWVERVTGDER